MSSPIHCVPDVLGRSLSEAKRILKQHGVHYTVRLTVPPRGFRLKADSEFEYYVVKQSHLAERMLLVVTGKARKEV